MQTIKKKYLTHFKHEIATEKVGIATRRQVIFYFNFSYKKHNYVYEDEHW